MSRTDEREVDLRSCSVDDSPNDSWSWVQTMNYVGQLAGQVFVQVKELYRGLNPATLSGCIDVIVVRRPDGSLHCSPFHVRFGKMGVLRSREKVVDIEVNGEPVSLHMKLGENGEAFFVEEAEGALEVVPSHLATSPIMSRGEVLMESQLGRSGCRQHDSITRSPAPPQHPAPQQSEGGMAKKRRKRRRKPRPDGGAGRREESGDEFSEDEDMFTIDLSSDEDGEGGGGRPVYGDQTSSRSTWACPQSNDLTEPLSAPPHCGLSISCPPHASHFPSPPSSDNSCSSTPKSDSELSTRSKDNPEMLWSWGELPQAAQPPFLTSHLKPAAAAAPSVPLSGSTHFRAIHAAGSSSISGEDKEAEEAKSRATDEAARAEERPGGQQEAVCFGSSGADAHPPKLQAEHVGEGARRTESPSRRKERRSQHLGADGVYLDDITELEPQVAALYFPKSDDGGGSKGDAEVMALMGLRGSNRSPQSVGSSGGDSGVDSLPELPHVAISLCGGLTDDGGITAGQFQERTVSFQQFSENPSIIDDPNLVVRIGSKYYNWSTAAPVMLAMQVYQKPLPQASVENIMKEKMPKKGGRWWFSWRSRNSELISEAAEAGGDRELAMNRMKDESSSSDEDRGSFKPAPQPMATSSSFCFKKTLRLTSEQLASLQLQDGPNEVVFSVTTQYQGTCRCHGTIYLWSWDDKIVISDIDGTITRSDTLGHILPTLGKDWTHQGIARLYHRVSQNGYKFMYCSARAIGMAGMTRGYLNWVNERGTMLPMGPVLLSPSSLFSALHREVIEKKPERFKIECLTDIKHLFHPNAEPFYAAFGNRATDVFSYKEVGVCLSRIFTVNPRGELVSERARADVSSFGRLCDMVDHVFPVTARGEGGGPFDQRGCWSGEESGGVAQGGEEEERAETRRLETN
ncbi:phosphatidate phosphatase LPIN1 isoform X2 [Betta splendens]|uniref:phosphatidate phosphatase n=1 Tax=Betta splendens TaxID=158456 RepID=A0A9W2XNN2_BETSP|nr:phosphatidate phosphatase LPIN1 isoform X2 [Betta splendens]